jgi:hypothetical protein
MTTVPEAPVPFFTDARSLTEKLAVSRREWRPTQPDSDSPPMIFGLVLERGEFFGKYSDDEPAPTARVLTGDNVEWSVVGFHGFLRSEFKRKNPRVGDFAAFAYQGTRAGRPGESDAFVYVVEVERNPDAVDVELDERGNETLAGSDPDPPLPQISPDSDVEGGAEDDLPF